MARNSSKTDAGEGVESNNGDRTSPVLLRRVGGALIILSRKSTKRYSFSRIMCNCVLFRGWQEEGEKKLCNGHFLDDEQNGMLTKSSCDQN